MRPTNDLTISSPLNHARTLIVEGRCVWCESAPVTATSYLCSDCARVDADGVLARVPATRVVAS
jgi:hypothetical protein